MIAKRSCEGWFQRRSVSTLVLSSCSFISAGFLLWNHPSRDPLRDPAALLTQEGIVAVTLFCLPS